MKNIIFLFLFFTTLSFSQQIGAKWLSAEDNTLSVTCQGTMLEIAVWDTGAADTIYLERIWTVDDTTLYPRVGQLKDLTTGANVTSIIGSSDEKLYVLWVPANARFRFFLSEYASGDVYVEATSKLWGP